jgi:hypothetical protein
VARASAGSMRWTLPHEKRLLPSEMTSRSVAGRACRPLPLGKGWMNTRRWWKRTPIASVGYVWCLMSYWVSAGSFRSSVGMLDSEVPFARSQSAGPLSDARESGGWGLEDPRLGVGGEGQRGGLTRAGYWGESPNNTGLDCGGEPLVATERCEGTGHCRIQCAGVADTGCAAEPIVRSCVGAQDLFERGSLHRARRSRTAHRRSLSC